MFHEVKTRWGQTDRQTDRPTDRPTDLGIEAPSRSLKIDQFGPSKDPGGPCFTKGPLKLASQGLFWGPFEGP